MHKKIFAFSILYFSTVLNASELPTLAYEKSAQRIMDRISQINKGMPSDFVTFCEDRRSDFQKLKEDKLDTAKSKKMLNSQWVFLFTLNYLQTDPSACFLFEFAKASEELMAHRIRRVLKCYTTTLEDFEAPYANELTKVDSETFAQKLDTIESKDIDSIQFEEASKLAIKLLEKARI